VRVLDTRSEPPFKAELARSVPAAEFVCAPLAENFDKQLLAGIDLVALSPGLSGGLMAVIHARAQGIPVIGEIELFAWALRDLGLRGTGPQHSRVLAITGTNGKTTTTALAGHLCRAAGRVTGVAGNISPAALTALMACLDAGKMPQVWVLELSSFQLETMASLDAMRWCSTSATTTDRYIDLDEYASAADFPRQRRTALRPGIEPAGRARAPDGLAGQQGHQLRPRRARRRRRLRPAREPRRTLDRARRQLPAAGFRIADCRPAQRRQRDGGAGCARPST
jgi:UDP-N-acetylmuramoylalanine-D-glutamate ligase